MKDTYAEFVRGPVGGFIAPKVGLPQPVKLDRYKPGAAGRRRQGLHRRRSGRPHGPGARRRR